MNQLLGAAIEVVSADPVTNLATGRLVYNKLTGIVRIYNGSAWADVNSTNPNVYFNKFVGSGAGYYTTLAAATATAVVGDHILVTDTTVEVSNVTVPGGVRVTGMPGAFVTFAGAHGFVLAGASPELVSIMAEWTGPSITNAFQITGDDAKLEATLRWSNANTLTHAVKIEAGADRANVRVGVRRASGTITNLLTDLATSSRAEVYGG